MNLLKQNIAKYAGVTIALSLSFVTSQQAQAATFDLGTGWNYSIGLASNGSGGPEFALSAIAFKEDAQNVYVAINGGADPAKGIYEVGATNNNINDGDLFFNFTGKDFATANASQSLFGIHFATNDSGVTETGVYSNVQAKSVALTHNGYSNLQEYFDSGWGYDLTQGSDLSTPQQTKDYYGNNGLSPVLNEIQTGKKVADISPLTAAVLGTLNFGKYGANSAYTFGFQFSKSALPVGDFMANLFFECANSGIAISGAIDPSPSSSVPEPLSILGMLFGCGGLLGIKLKRQSENI
jgi:hypothetical protein